MARGKHKKASRFQKIMTILLAVFLVGIIACCVAFALLVDTTSWENFDPQSMTNVSQTLYVYDNMGQEVAGLYKENRTYISIDEIPGHVQDAFIAIEDTRFYKHNGIDYKRFLGSLFANIKSRSFAQGFSTISQQLIKNTHLTTEKTINRKVQEMYLATRLENKYTKDEIMEMYLNYVYFGNGAYGIEAAAQSYFGKSASELTIAEGAMLAGVINAPGVYAPHIDLEKSVERRNLVISQMYKYELISLEEKEESQNEEPLLNLSRPNNTQYGQFVDYAVDEASAILGMSYENMTSSGYKIYTTMDTETQSSAQMHFSNPELFPDNADDDTIVEGAAVVIDSTSGAVKAIIGGREYTAKGFNRAVDMRRQPGSTIKPILVYGPAIDRNGYNGATLIEDKEININGYAPNNYNNSFSGWVSARKAVKSSLNIPAVLVLNDIGVSTGKDYAERSGIVFDETDNHLSLALGGFKYGVTVMELAGSYMPYANSGMYIEPYVITRIEDSYGNEVYTHEVHIEQILQSSSAFIMTDILEDTAESGTAHRANISGIDVAGKTGTVSYKSGLGVNDAWTVAYTTEDIIAVWNGFDMPSDTHTMSSSATGGRYPALMINAILSDIYSNHSPADFPKHPDVVSVRLDSVLYEEYQQIALATEYTPEDKAFYEYFKVQNQPVNVSPYWQIPQTVTDLTGSLNQDNQPVLSFTPPQMFMIYSLVRQQDTEELSDAVPIATFDGASGTVSYIDTDELGGKYKYFVIPYNPNVPVDAGYLAGESSAWVEVNVPIENDWGFEDGFDFSWDNGEGSFWPWNNGNKDDDKEDNKKDEQVTPTPEASPSPTPTLLPTATPEEETSSDDSQTTES